MNLESIFERQQELEDYEEDFNIIKYSNGLTEINAPYDTRVAHTNPNREVTYFDIKPLLLIISDLNGDFSKDHQGEIFTLYGSIGGYQYKVTINAKSPMVEMINTTLNINTNFSSYEIPELEYPFYQFTSNPIIVLLLLFVTTCYASDKESIDLMYAAEIIANGADKDETYHLDEFGILVLSVYQQCFWTKQEDIIKIIDDKIEIIKEKLVDLELENVTADSVYTNHAPVMFGNINNEIKSLKAKIVAYAKLESMLKLVKPNDEIMEVKVGNKSHFMLRRGENIMTILKDQFNTPKITTIDPELKTVYSALCRSHDSTVYNYNQWCDNLMKKNNNFSNDNIPTGCMPYCT